jgi:HAMP domain-containing protein
MGSISDRAQKRWDDKVPDNGALWPTIRDVLLPMMREMADEIEATRAELAAMRESRRKKRR